METNEVILRIRKDLDLTGWQRFEQQRKSGKDVKWKFRTVIEESIN
jgi:hypothetical protein